MNQAHDDTSLGIPASVGQALCGIVHDLSNLIQTIILRAEVTSATEPVSQACARRMEQIVEDGQTGANVVRSLLEHARRRVDSIAPADLRPLIEKKALAVSSATGVAVSLHTEDSPIVGRADPMQMEDLLTLLLTELSRGSDPEASYAVSLAHARTEGDALAWMSEDRWAVLRIERCGDGPGLDVEEGHIGKFVDLSTVDDKIFNCMRIRGIMRQHRGQIRATEQVDDNRLSFAVEAFFPLSS